MDFKARYNREIKRSAAMTLVEVMVAATVLFVVVWGALAFVVSGRTTVERAGQERTAAKIAAERLELARAGGYAALRNGSGSVAVGGTQYRWRLAVRHMRADPGDSKSTYKRMQITVDWPTANGRTVVARSSMAP